VNIQGWSAVMGNCVIPFLIGSNMFHYFPSAISM